MKAYYEKSITNEDVHHVNGPNSSCTCFRIESRHPLLGQLLPDQRRKTLFGNRSLAVAIAVKSVVDPTSQQVRVVHVPSGEIVFDTQPEPLK